MSKTLSSLPVAVAVLWFAGIDTAAAQTAPAAEPALTTIENVTVVAPRIVWETRSSGPGAPRQVRVNQQSAVIDASDLDLTRIADMSTLKARVAEAAARVCGELADMHPGGQPETPVCVKRASEDAMAHVDEVTRRIARR